MSIINNLYHYGFTVKRIIDGDTVEGILDKGFYDENKKTQVRFLGIQCPEISKAKTPEEKERGYAAKAFVSDLLLNQYVVLNTHKVDPDDDFSRILADVYIPAIGLGKDLHVNQFLIDSGHAIKWYPK